MTTAGLLISPRGRIGRSVYWLAIVPLILAGTLGWLISSSPDPVTSMFGGGVTVLVIWPLVAVNVKRWHDRDKSGMWLFVGFLPVLGQLWSLVECGLMPGNVGYNGYGEPPEPQSLLPKVEKQPDVEVSESGMALAEAGADAAKRLDPSLVGLATMTGLFMRIDQRDQGKKLEFARAFLQEEMGLSKQSLDDAVAVTQGARLSRHTVEESAEATKAAYTKEIEVEGEIQITLDTSKLNSISDFLFSIASLDGSLSENEEILIVQLHRVFGFNGSQYSSHRYKERSWRAESASHIPEGHHERHYAKVLGLETEARVTPDDLKKAFRLRVKEFHPDKVAHMGEQMRDAADIEMKKVNEAYTYFTRMLKLS